MEKFSWTPDYPILFESPCAFCVHKHGGTATCFAYPNGIPDPILMGESLHMRRRRDQVGTYLFEPSHPLHPQQLQYWRRRGLRPKPE